MKCAFLCKALSTDTLQPLKFLLFSEISDIAAPTIIVLFGSRILFSLINLRIDVGINEIELD